VASPQDALRLERRGDIDARRCQYTFHLPALGASVAEARQRVRTRLRDWGAHDETQDDAEMVVSELFTNAVRHTDSERVICTLRLTGTLLRLEVADQGCTQTEPRSREAEADEESGRGLLLVGALSKEWGSRPNDRGPGRVVWAELSPVRILP
jgi:serine/threonine-protein kinase RsbW